MKRQAILFSALTVAASLGLLGCEDWQKQSLRKKDNDSSNVRADDLDSSVPKGQHSGSVKAGTWSDQAREIESHFGQ